MISSCDKNVPGHLLAAARLDIPVTFVPGGPMASGIHDGRDATISKLDGECFACGVGKANLTIEELDAMEEAVCPGAGSCALLGTANTMQCLTEALGLALPGAGTALAVSAKRLWIAKESGRQIVRLVEKDIACSRILTKKSIVNAIKVLHALGGSTNAIVHLLALSYEKRWDDEINLALVEKLGREVPCITDVEPGGTHTMQDFDFAGGVQAVMKIIQSMLDGDVLTVSGISLEESLSQVSVDPNRSKAIRDLDDPISENSLMVLSGNLADSAVVRATVIPEDMLQHKGPAKVFNGQEDALDAIKQGAVAAGDVVVLRYEGPKGGPGFNEVYKVIGYLNAAGLGQKCAMVTDGRVSGFAKGPFICQVSPEAASGGALAIIEDGDIIEIDIPGRSLNLELSKDEIKARFETLTPPPPRVTDGFLTVYAKLAKPPEKGGGIDLRLK
jgi:dihydroxy-acid dehydratase